MVLNNDNAESRQFIESCYTHRKTLLNPIINWSDAEVWEFIHKYNVPYCKLYDQGYKRLGCIGCPMNTATAAEDLERYPTYKRAYLRAFDKMLKVLKGKGRPSTWDNPDEVMAWWLKGRVKVDEVINGQINIWEDLDE